jgi:ammonia channel protein AmtB
MSLFATPALAETADISAADTAWMIVATALVLMMTIPGLALFYSGMVRKKNVLATMAQSLAAVTIISILWVAFGYSLVFVGEGSLLGTLDRWFLAGMTMDGVNPAAKTIPESLFMLYQMTFAIITVALVAGSVADRMRFSAYILFSIGWFMFVYVPLAHWVWGGGFLGTMGVLDFAGGLVVHLSAGIGGLVAARVIGPRHGYGTENLSPFDLSLAVAGTGLLWVGWFGFNGGSALKHRFKYDDSLDVFGVHGIGGMSGILLVGVFATASIGGTSGLIEGNAKLLLIQLSGVLVTLGWSGAVTYVLLKLVGAFVPLRVSREQELEGLDISQHGEALQ